MYQDLPKIELHLHLDCSLSYEVVHKIDSTITLKSYRDSFIAPAKCNDLADYITRANNAIELMQTKEHLRWVVLDLFDQLKKDNIIYAEIRFAPLLHINKGLTSHEVVQTVHEATLEGINLTGINAGIILCTLRHYNELQSIETVKLVETFRNTTIVGFDIAADEAGFPIDAHIKAFEYAKRKNINCTAHAVEAKGCESVWETLRNFHPSRIGHGVRSYEDPKLIEYLIEKKIHLEVCPTSNIQTNVYPSIQKHTVSKIYNAGVSMSVNTDAKTISNTSLSNEYQILEKEFNWTKAHFLACNINAVNASFTNNTLKAFLKNTLIKAYS